MLIARYTNMYIAFLAEIVCGILFAIKFLLAKIDLPQPAQCIVQYMPRTRTVL